MQRVILHSDMNSFYASVETMLNPSLKGKAVAVCGSTENRHGIVLAKSILAKKAGVKTGMVNHEAAELCKDLIMVAPHYEEYLKYSRCAHKIYLQYTNLVEPYGMDECWLDVSCSQRLGTGEEIADKIRNEIKSELGLTVSIGVSFNKIFAKLGSDMKKPDAVTVINEENFKQKVWPLDASELLYIGPSTRIKLKKYGIVTVGDVAAADPQFLKSLIGINGLKMWNYANGTDRSAVKPYEETVPIKSIGHGITCSGDLENKEEIFRVIHELTQDIGKKLKENDLRACGVQVSLRKDDLEYENFQQATRYPVQLPSELAGTAMGILSKELNGQKKIRAVTIRAINLIPDKESWQINIWSDYAGAARREGLQSTIESLRDRFGKKILTYCALMGDLKMPCDKREIVKLPGIMYS